MDDRDIDTGMVWADDQLSIVATMLSLKMRWIILLSTRDCCGYDRKIVHMNIHSTTSNTRGGYEKLGGVTRF